MVNKMEFKKEIVKLISECETELKGTFLEIDNICYQNSLKVLDALQISLKLKML